MYMSYFLLKIMDNMVLIENIHNGSQCGKGSKLLNWGIGQGACGPHRGPVSTCTYGTQSHTGLFISLSPHRVPDGSHPCQHQSQNTEFPSIETLVITVYYRHCLCHYLVSYSSVRLLSKL